MSASLPNQDTAFWDQRTGFDAQASVKITQSNNYYLKPRADARSPDEGASQ
ncbi:MAG: hypothetical protein ACREAB_06350 [Blastocatellia bacterium]